MPLVLDSIERAPRHGFDAIQFNLVFASNPARRLYEELGWREIGRVPEAVDGEDAVIYGAPFRLGSDRRHGHDPLDEVDGAVGQVGALDGQTAQHLGALLLSTLVNLSRVLPGSMA